MFTSTLLLLTSILTATHACLFSTFHYNPCTHTIYGLLEDNGHSYGQILDSTPMDRITTPGGIAISLTPQLRALGQSAYVHEVRAEDGNSGYLSHVTIHQGGAVISSFELVKDRNGDYSNAVYGCEDVPENAWFHGPSQYGGRDGWARWRRENPVADLGTAGKVCEAVPEQPKFAAQTVTAEASVETEVVVEQEEGEKGGNMGFRGAKRNSFTALNTATFVTKTQTGTVVPLAVETGLPMAVRDEPVRGGNQGFRGEVEGVRGGNQGFSGVVGSAVNVAENAWRDRVLRGDQCRRGI